MNTIRLLKKFMKFFKYKPLVLKIREKQKRETG